MTSPMLQPALNYHNEGLCVIPVKANDKAPALPTWEEYQTRQSTEQEIRQWWGNGHNYNVGIVHGEVSGNYIALDIDHNAGIMTDLVNDHDYLFNGRIEQSGSGQGYHIPIRLDTLPDFGVDTKQNRPRGNRTWKTSRGMLNIRCRFCQTVAPPSIHPSGNPYKFIQTGDILRLPNLDSLIAWLDKLAPPPKQSTKTNKPTAPARSDDLLSEVKAAWDCLKVFDHFSMAGQRRQEHNGEIRLLGNGGLLITEDLEQWYNFSDDFGGDCITAWGYCRLGSSYDNAKHFRQMLLEMAEAAGIATDKRTGQAITGDFPPLNIPPGDKIIVVAGEDKAEVLKDAGYCAVGLPGRVFKRQWARLFNPNSIVYIALDPGKDEQARAIATEFKANGLTAYTCSMPVSPDEMIRCGANHTDFVGFLKQGH